MHSGVRVGYFPQMLEPAIRFTALPHGIQQPHAEPEYLATTTGQNDVATFVAVEHADGLSVQMQEGY